MEINVSYRIKRIAGSVEKCGVIADIGCDHGFIAYCLLKDNVCQKAVLTDISSKSLNKAKKLFLKSNLIERTDFRAGSGLSVLREGEADFAVIAGIGGMEIISILKEGDRGIKGFLLQPMKNTRILREFLIKNNFKLEKDFIIFDNKHFYDIIIVSKGQDSLNNAELEFGRDNIKNKTEEFIRFLNYRKAQTGKILQRVNSEKKEELIGYLKLIEELLKA